jgi:hypothetical protein
METRPPATSFREKLEALMFAGLKPGMRSSQIQQLSWKNYLRRAIFAAAGVAVIGCAFYWVAVARRPDFERAWERFTGGEVGAIAASDVEVIDLSMNMDAEPKVIAGKVRNNSEKSYSRIDVTFALTDAMGSAVGAEKVSVSNVGAKSAVPFRATIATRDAAYYVVRDIQPF